MEDASTSRGPHQARHERAPSFATTRRRASSMVRVSQLTSSGWEMCFRDEATAVVLRLSWTDENRVRLSRRREPDGHVIAYARDASGLLLRWSLMGRASRSTKISRKRIVRASAAPAARSQQRLRRGRPPGSRGDVGRHRPARRGTICGIVSCASKSLAGWSRTSSTNREGGTTRSSRIPRTITEQYVAETRYVVEKGSVLEADFDEEAGSRCTGTTAT